MSAPLPCIVCDETPEPLFDPKSDDHGPAQPLGALRFSSPGAYGSDFDPADGSVLIISVCDRCLRVKAGQGFGAVWYRRYVAPRLEDVSEPWRPGEGDS